jgi:hypothetical protein
MNRVLLIQGGLYTLIGALTPVPTVLASEQRLTPRSITWLVIIALIAGGNALKAFLSTTFSESSASLPDKPNHRTEAAAQAVWQAQS